MYSISVSWNPCSIFRRANSVGKCEYSCDALSQSRDPVIHRSGVRFPSWALVATDVFIKLFIGTELLEFSYVR